MTITLDQPGQTYTQSGNLLSYELGVELVADGTTLVVTGRIRSERGATAVMITGNGGTIVNQSYAEITSTNDTVPPAFRTNAAIRGSAGDDVIVNNGAINGSILLGNGSNSITNNGTINSLYSYSSVINNIILGNGNDSFTNAGQIFGNVMLGAGNDSFTSLRGSGLDYSLDLGEGDDSLHIYGGYVPSDTDGGAGNDTIYLHGGVGSLGRMKSFENLWIGKIEELPFDYSAGEVSGANNFQRIELEAGAAVRFTNSKSPDIDLRMTGGRIFLNEFSTFRNIIGSDQAETVGLAADSYLTGSVSLGGGDDTIIIYNQSARISYLGINSVDGGDGIDTVVLETPAWVKLNLTFGNDEGFILHTSNGYLKTALKNIEFLKFTDRTLSTAQFTRINAVYQALAGRDANTGEMIVWTDAIAAGKNETAIREAIIADWSSGFAIDTVYRQMLGRSSSAEEVAIWRGLFRQGADLNTLRFVIGEALAVIDGLVDALYREFGNRPAAAGELKFWRGQILDGTSLATIKTAIVDDQIGAEAISHSYSELFGRAATAGEIATWRSLFKNGADIRTLHSAILGEAAGKAHANSAIDALYHEFGSRAATGAEVDYWRSVLAAGGHLADVKKAIVADVIGHDTIDHIYATLFGRAATAQEIATWRSLFDAGADTGSLRNAILAEPSARAHVAEVITHAYQDFGGRAPTADELRFWSDAFRSGVDEAHLRNVILDDPLGQYAIGRIAHDYQLFFHRAPTQGETLTWTDLFHQGVNPDQMVDALMTDLGSQGIVQQVNATAGADNFRVADLPGNLVINNFDPANDRIDLRGTAFAGRDPVAAGLATDVHALDGTNDVLIHLGDSNTILLQDMTLARLGASGFQF